MYYKKGTQSLREEELPQIVKTDKDEKKLYE